MPALELNIALLRKEAGYLVETLDYLRSAYDGAKSETGSAQRAIANRAIAIWMIINARIGRMKELKRLLRKQANADLPVLMRLFVTQAKESLALMLGSPQISFKCGPAALNNWINITRGTKGLNKTIKDFPSTSEGTNLAQIKQLADRVGIKVQMAKRSPGAEVITPSVMHWKLDHFACITSRRAGRFWLLDPTFGDNSHFSLSPAALEAATDGYFLVPAGQLPKGWQSVSEDEAAKVWGKGSPGARNDAEMTPCAPKKWCQQCGKFMPAGTGGGCIAHGLAQAAMYTMQATLNIVDAPLSYSTPYGTTYFQPNYNQLEANQPSSFSFSNLGQDWSINWLSYLTLDMSSNATVRVRGGGSEVYTPNSMTGLYTPNHISQALLVKIGTNNYQRQLPDGSMEVFNQADGSGNIFMTEYVDAQGNIWNVQFDTNFRITHVTDPLSQQSTFSYLSNTVGNAGFYCISQIADPFSRVCTFAWNATDTEIISITDVVGNVSQFAYDSGSSFINTLTTGYGATKFTAYTPIGQLLSPDRGLRVGYPDGSCSLIEGSLAYQSTFYWDREAMQQFPADAATGSRRECETTVFMFDDTDTFLLNPIVYSITPALQQSGYGPGNLSIPYQYSYAGQGTANRLDQNLIGKPIRISTNLSYFAFPLATTLGGTVTPGDTVTMTVFYGPPPSSYNHTVITGDTLSSIAASLSAAMNADINLAGTGFASTTVGPVIYTSFGNWPINSAVGGSVSSGATETVATNAQQQQGSIINISGTVHVGDVEQLVINDENLSGGSASESYTVMTGDTLASIAAAYAALINADPKLVPGQYHAIASGPNITITNYSPDPVYYTSSGSAEFVIADTIDTNGSFQTSQYQWNSLGYCTQKISPTLRVDSYTYATNNIDLLSAAETKAADNFLLGSWTYNTQHRPLTYTDGSGNTTQYTYNTTGELKDRSRTRSETRRH